MDYCAAAHLAASFYIVPFMVFSICCLVNGSITSEVHSEVRPAWMLSHWRILTLLSVPLFHSGHAVSACNQIQPLLLLGILY